MCPGNFNDQRWSSVLHLAWEIAALMANSDPKTVVKQKKGNAQSAALAREDLETTPQSGGGKGKGGGGPYLCVCAYTPFSPWHWAASWLLNIQSIQIYSRTASQNRSYFQVWADLIPLYIAAVWMKTAVEKVNQHSRLESKLCTTCVFLILSSQAVLLRLCSLSSALWDTCMSSRILPPCTSPLPERLVTGKTPGVSTSPMAVFPLQVRKWWDPLTGTPQQLRPQWTH